MLAGHVQDEVEQAQMAHFPNLPQLLQGLLGMNVLVFIPPGLQERGLRNQDWARAQEVALQLGLKGQAQGSAGLRDHQALETGHQQNTLT